MFSLLCFVNFELVHHELDQLKVIFKRNGYPNNVIDFCIKSILTVIDTIPRKEVATDLPTF